MLDIAVGFIDDPIRSIANGATPFLSDPLPVFIRRQEPRCRQFRAAHARFQLTTQKLGCYVLQPSKDKIDADEPFRGVDNEHDLLCFRSMTTGVAYPS